MAACAADLPVDNNGVVTAPTAEQRHLLETIWATFCSEKAWPKYVGVEKKLSDGGLNLRQLTESMPSGLMIPDVHVRPFVWTPQGNDELRVELHGLRYCSNAGSELALLARVARYFADREKVFDVGPLSAPAGLNITSAEVQNDLRLSDEQTQLVYRVITNFRIGTSGSSGPDPWSCTIDIEEIRRYRDIETGEDLLAAAPASRVAMQPVPVEPSQESRHCLRSSLRLGREVIEHKIVSGIIVIVVGAAIITLLHLR